MACVVSKYMLLQVIYFIIFLLCNRIRVMPERSLALILPRLLLQQRPEWPAGTKSRFTIGSTGAYNLHPAVVTLFFFALQNDYGDLYSCWRIANRCSFEILVQKKKKKKKKKSDGFLFFKVIM